MDVFLDRSCLENASYYVPTVKTAHPKSVREGLAACFFYRYEILFIKSKKTSETRSRIEADHCNEVLFPFVA